MKVTEYTLTGSKGTRIVSDEVFAVALNAPLLSQAIRVYQANAHQSTSAALTRSDIARTKRKWFKQKGTGNARHGARSAPIFVGGGVAHGPKSLKAANFKLTGQQKVRALAVALSARVDICTVIPGLEVMDHKTAPLARLIKELGIPSGEQILLCTSGKEVSIARAARNIPNLSFVPANQIHVLDVASVRHLIFSPEAIKILEERIQGTSVKSKPAVAAKSSAPKVDKPAAKSTTTKTTKKVVKPAVKKPAAKKPAAKKAEAK